MIIQGDSKEKLRELPEESYHSCVTDPPYELGFMNRQWDDSGIAFDTDFWREVKRVLRPGAHLVAFGGSRTHHRMMVAIEDAGFEIRDTLMWVYGCISPDTDILTSEGWKGHSEISEGDTVVCYDKDTGTYKHGPVQRKLEKYNQPHAFRIRGENTDQIVSPEHRVLVERGGNLEFERAWRLAREQKISVPVLESLRRVREDLSGDEQVTNKPKQHLQQSLRKRANIKEAQWKTANETKRLYGGSNLRNLRRRFLEKTRSNRQRTGELLFQRVLCEVAKRKRRKQISLERNSFEGNRRLEQRADGKAFRTDDRKIESELEGGSYLQRRQRELRQNRVGEVSGGVRRDGTKERLCARTQDQSCARNRSSSQRRRSRSSHRSRPAKQRDRKLDAFSQQQRAQALRAQRGARTDLATIEPIEYGDMFWCVKVPTGAFVARRNGKIFVTGNSGFPKNLDVSKEIDRKKGEDREVVGTKQIGNSKRTDGKDWKDESGFSNGEVEVTEPASEEAKKWDGWGTALKPGYEPICLARKPLSEDTVAENVMKHSAGAINIDDCRIGDGGGTQYVSGGNESKNDYGDGLNSTKDVKVDGLGRWPNNLLLDDRASVMLDEQGGESSSSIREPTGGKILDPEKGWNQNSMEDKTVRGYNDEGGVSRFYKSVGNGRWPTNFVIEEEAAELLDKQSGTLHSRGNVNQSTSGGGTGNTVNPGPTHKSHHHERDLLHKDGGAARFFYCPKAHKGERNIGAENNEHPTVKPIELMAYLIRLTTPEGGKTLDPFGGSGTTGIAAVLEQKDAVLVEKDADHAELAQKRIEYVMNNTAKVREKVYEDPSNQLTEEGKEVSHDFW